MVGLPKSQKGKQKTTAKQTPTPQLGFRESRISIIFLCELIQKTLLSCFLLSLASSAENAEHYVGNVARQNSPSPVLQHKAGETVDVRGPEGHVIQSSEEVLLELFHQKGGLGRVRGIELQREAGGVSMALSPQSLSQDSEKAGRYLGNS